MGHYDLRKPRAHNGLLAQPAQSSWRTSGHDSVSCQISLSRRSQGSVFCSLDHRTASHILTLLTKDVDQLKTFE